MSNIINASGMDTITGQFNIADPDDAFQVPSLLGNSSTPSLVLGAAAGTGAVVNSIVGTNVAGKINFTSGTLGLAAGTVMTMTFANSLVYPNGCSITFSSGNAAFAGVITLVSATTTTTTVVLNVAAALTLSTNYQGFYQVIGY